jgi:hypothetical protein
MAKVDDFYAAIMALTHCGGGLGNEPVLLTTRQVNCGFERFFQVKLPWSKCRPSLPGAEADVDAEIYS